MKKYLIFLFVMMLICSQPVSAKMIKVRALEDFSTANPPETWKVQLVDGFETKDGTPYYAGSIIYGRIEDIKDPKRLKRNAQFTFVPTEYYDSMSQKTYAIKRQFKGKYSSMSDVTVGSVVKTGAVAAGSHFISGFIGPSVALVEGAVKNEEGNRAKSAAKSVYESTPVSYVEKGKQLEIKENQEFVMSFKLANDDSDEE